MSVMHIFLNTKSLHDYYVLKKDRGRSILLLNLSPFAIKEDIRQLRDEFRFCPDPILMRYPGSNGHLLRNDTIVVFPAAEHESRAQKKLKDAPLFDTKIIVVHYKPLERVSGLKFGWG
jgi:hypothetical protein